MNKILVVNNDLDTMQLLKQWLEKRSYEVRYTGTREDVAGMVKDFMPGLVIADILQHEVINDLRSDPNSRDIPILMMSGYTDGGLLKRPDVNDIIEKPLNLALLEKKVQQLIQENRQ